MDLGGSGVDANALNDLLRFFKDAAVCDDVSGRLSRRRCDLLDLSISPPIEPENDLHAVDELVGLEDSRIVPRSR